ncbi:hypothetical protein DACRYDRAFT_118194 [Dacryopinax primogenitus]|uniref:Proteasome assembly chaperone 2 n=1 Tax=Dacryopinax primogenitus (strain DJM 731) TaxID=1858805 RepID=M5FSJ9_DACPD|nr:uncharacterized protein DACRYDRAFT_118194 [Dacryopinax primogenitus]EJT98878.1 hypothetical protein DACRYDRAFT_118194 [Dacryopinax primogenitus]
MPPIPINYSQFKGKTLILPIVSVGNVPQLACDLLIASLGLGRLEILSPEWVISCAGGRQDGVRGVTTPLEVFGKEGVDLVVLQQRSPAFTMYKDQFTQQITAFVREGEFENVLLLSGADVIGRDDRHMLSPIFHYPATSAQTPFHTRLTLTTPAFLSSPLPALPPIPGSGLLRRMLALLPAQGPSIGVLLQFAMEGDNRGDAHFLAECAAKVGDVRVAKWEEPPSWRVGLFGTPQEQTLYG